MKQNKHHALREQAESWADKVAVYWHGQSYDVSIWWTTERRRRRPDGGQAKMRAETAEKNKSRSQRGGGFSLNLYLPGVSKWSGVISHDMSRHIVISYFEVFHLMRYHKIRYIEILYYPYPEFLGLISRYRMPLKYFSIPKTIFCPLRCSKFGAPESWRNGYLEV